jgi:hypothetical protein
VGDVMRETESMSYGPIYLRDIEMVIGPKDQETERPRDI